NAACASVLDSINVYQAEAAAGRPVFRTGHLQSYDATVTGGNEGVRFFLSGAGGRDEGIVSYNWRSHLTTRANIEIVPSSQVDIGVNLSYLENEARLAQQPNGYDI